MQSPKGDAVPHDVLFRADFIDYMVRKESKSTKGDAVHIFII